MLFWAWGYNLPSMFTIKKFQQFLNLGLTIAMDLLHFCFLFLSHDVKFFSNSWVEEVINLKHIYIQLIYNSILSISLILSLFLFSILCSIVFFNCLHFWRYCYYKCCFTLYPLDWPLIPGGGTSFLDGPLQRFLLRRFS